MKTNITVSFLNNTTRKPEVYIGKSEFDGYTLTITTDSSTSVLVKQVTIQFPTSIFSVDDVKNITVNNWNVTQQGPNLSLSSTDGVSWNASSPITLSLSGVRSEHIEATNAQLRLHVNGDIAITTIFLLRYPDEALNLNEYLGAQLLPIAKIYRTPTGKKRLENVLHLLLTNKNLDQPLVTKPWTNTPTLIVSFVYGDGIGALTPADNATSDPFTAWNIRFSVEESYQQGSVTYQWTAVNPDSGSTPDTPVWRLQPVSENSEVLGPQSGANVKFRISGISTQNIAGSTQMYLQYSNFPGYNDGYFTLNLEKVEPESTIILFDGQPNYVAALGDKVTLRWQTFDVDKVELQFNGITLSSTKGEINIAEGTYSCTIDRTTDFILKAYDKISDANPQHSLQWTGHVPDARINNFSTSEYTPVVGKPVTLNWSTVAARSGEIRSSDGKSYQIPAAALAKGSREYYPQRATTYTLHIEGENASPDASLSVFYLPKGWSMWPMGLNPNAVQGPVLLSTSERLVLVGGQSGNGIFASSDGQRWEEVGLAQFPARNFAAGTLHNGKLWIMGGTNDNGNPLQDVWSSDNGGSTWTQVCEKAPWQARSRFSCVSFKDKIWLMGGLDQNLKPLGDIWNSDDGITWTQVAPSNYWSPRSGGALAIHDEKLWLFGGLINQTIVSDELWVSADGVTWKQEKTGEQYSQIPGRQQAVLASLGDILYLTGGIDGQGTALNALYFYKKKCWKIGNGTNLNVSQTGFTIYRNALWIAGGLDGKTSNNVVMVYYPQG